MSNQTKAFIALIITVLFWSLGTIAIRFAIADIPSYTLLFIRFLVASLIVLPFFLKEKPWKHSMFPTLLKIASLSALNQIFFIYGIRYTTATAAQVIYATIPLFIIVVSFILFREKFPFRKIAGVVIGLVGISVILSLSYKEQGLTISGGINGNSAIVVAALAWTIFILLSKRMSKHFSPIVIGSMSCFFPFLVSIPFMTIEQIVFHAPTHITAQGIFAIVFAGIFGTVGAYSLYQYAIKHLEPLTVGLSYYLQPIVTVLLASVLLGEKLTFQFAFGSLLVFCGIFITTTLEIYHQRKRTSR